MTRPLRFRAIHLALLPLLQSAAADPLSILSLTRDGLLTWTNAAPPAVCTVESAPAPTGPWSPRRNAFVTTTAGSTTLPADGDTRFHRLRSVPISPTPAGFSNLVAAYGILETIAGIGAGQTDGVSYWQDWFEGNPAAWAALSRPHFAMADRAGNVFIADKGSHSVLRIDTQGNLHTHAGTHQQAFDGDGPAPATQLSLNQPNALWVRPDGTVYVLDTGNGRVRRVDTEGRMSTLFLATPNGSNLAGGRSLWVSDDESAAAFGNETRIRSWTRSGGLATLASGFGELGDLYVEANGSVLACDRGDHRVYRVTPSGSKTIIAGNGETTGGGDGTSALATGLEGPRGIWPMPTGGYLILTHDGCQLWYLDSNGILHLLVHGAGGRTHDGDGLPFYDPTVPKISEGRSVSLDHQGNILICESDWGYIRRIRFEPLDQGPSGLSR